MKNHVLRVVCLSTGETTYYTAADAPELFRKYCWFRESLFLTAMEELGWVEIDEKGDYQVVHG